MRLARTRFDLAGVVIPAASITVDHALGHILMLHGYGGNKEEMIGLGFRLAEVGYACTAIDMRGHGENTHPYDGHLLDDAERVLALLPGPGRRVALGHSLGGRLALLTRADARIGVSPAVAQHYSDATRALINSMRQQKVRENDPGINFAYLAELPCWGLPLTAADLVLYARQEIPEIVSTLNSLPPAFTNVRVIERVMHGDIFLDETAIQVMLAHLATLASGTGDSP
jgi:pimeloyl-ACP methyl ester carboxylesterase